MNVGIENIEGGTDKFKSELKSKEHWNQSDVNPSEWLRPVAAVCVPHATDNSRSYHETNKIISQLIIFDSFSVLKFGEISSRRLRKIWIRSWNMNIHNLHSLVIISF